MRAVRVMLDGGMSLRKALQCSRCSRKLYYHCGPTPRVIGLDPSVVDAVKRVTLRRPSYDIRRVGVMLPRELGRPVNRRRVQRIYRTLNWIEPSKRKSEIIRSATRTTKATRPYELWDGDLTYVLCGSTGGRISSTSWTSSRERVGYAFDTSAVKENAIMHVNNTIASHPQANTELTLRCDNGSQYRSGAFRESMRALGIRVEFIYANTPEQNGHVESFHKTLKREHLWPRDFRNYQEAEMAIADAAGDYNRDRIHSSLGYRTPYEFLEEWRRVHN